MKNLTARYSATQFCYWMAFSGAGSFATVYLLSKGISSGVVGAIMASASLLSCLIQPVIASFADRSRKFILPQLLIIMSAVCCLSFGIQLMPGLPLYLCGGFYALGIFSSDAMISLLNALSVAYSDRGYTINYGVGRGIGAAATAISSLVLGYLISFLGTKWMLVFVMTAWVVFAVVIAGYPHMEKSFGNKVDETQEECGILTFFRRYKWYCISLAGVLFLGMYHVMTENYMIAIMERLGGDSSHVGVALFISALVTFPMVCLFSKINSRINETNLLKISVVAYMVKAVCFYFAQSVGAIYAFQFLQIFTYAILAPSQVAYANSRVGSKDMVKGQAFMTAAYALGCSAGSFTGGQLLNFGVETLLVSGVFMTVVGALIIFLTVNRSKESNASL